MAKLGHHFPFCILSRHAVNTWQADQPNKDKWSSLHSSASMRVGDCIIFCTMNLHSYLSIVIIQSGVLCLLCMGCKDGIYIRKFYIWKTHTCYFTMFVWKHHFHMTWVNDIGAERENKKEFVSVFIQFSRHQDQNFYPKGIVGPIHNERSELWIVGIQKCRILE